MMTLEHASIKQLGLYPDGTKFFIKMKNFETGNVKILKDITIQDYEKSLRYCKYLNARGYNVFFSPRLSSSGGVYVLLDDVKNPDIDRLFSDGFEPFYFLETSQKNYQAIIKLSDSPLDKDIQTFISKQLSEIYDADPNSTDPGHFFRIAGFTNRKTKYKNEKGLYPYIKLYIGTKKHCKKGQEYIYKILEGIQSGFIELPKKEKNITTPPGKTGRKETLETGCLSYVKKIYESNKQMSDLSRLDFKVAKYAIAKGFKIQDIENAIKMLSPYIETRKKYHIDDYVNRTVKNALE